jgi:hypothetical protein
MLTADVATLVVVTFQALQTYTASTLNKETQGFGG